MKKLISWILAIVMVLSVAVLSVYAVSYEQPFAEGTQGSKNYRIPSLYTLNDGSVLAIADKCYEHGSDSPNNIDIQIAKSANGYTDWEYSMLNYFDDCADEVVDTYSASFIDSAVVQSKKTGRIYVVSDVWPSGGGYFNALTGTGFTDINGTKHLLLTDRDYSDKLYTFNYYVGDYIGGFAPIFKKDTNTITAYAIDEYFNLYKNGVPLYQKQIGSDKMVQQNIFYNDSDLTCYKTSYLVLKTSDDNGETWSAPVLLSGQVKEDGEMFLGIGPGRGLTVTLPDGTERIIFMVYDNKGDSITLNQDDENVSTIYSDDEGITWHRGAETSCRKLLEKTSEAQIIELGNGVLRVFARNAYDYVSYADSTDYGVTWSQFRADEDLKARGNCMVSFINTSKTIDGKPVVLGSFVSKPEERVDGVIKTGVIENGDITWIKTYHINDGFFSYSCLTELSDGNFGLLYEDAASKISYMVLTMDAEGNMSEVNGNNAEYQEDSVSFGQKIKNFFSELLEKIYKLLGWF